MKNEQLNYSDHTPAAKKYPLCYLAHDIDVPMNVGSFFRVADALGMEKIYLTGHSATPPNRKTKRTSRSTEKHVEYAYNEDPIEIIEQLKGNGYKIVSLELTTNSIAIKELTVCADEKICLLLGSESAGVSQSLLNASDVSVHIPMLGQNSSMNVANACSIASYEMIRRYE